MGRIAEKVDGLEIERNNPVIKITRDTAYVESDGRIFGPGLEPHQFSCWYCGIGLDSLSFNLHYIKFDLNH